MNRESAKALSVRLKEMRIAHGYTQSNIAGAIDIRQSTYSHYETGVRIPSTRILYRIANFYGLPVDDLLKLSIPLNSDIYYDAPKPSPRVKETTSYLAFVKGIDERALSSKECELLYHFSRLTTDGRQEVIDFAAFKHEKEVRVHTKSP